MKTHSAFVFSQSASDGERGDWGAYCAIISIGRRPLSTRPCARWYLWFRDTCIASGWAKDREHARAAVILSAEMAHDENACGLCGSSAPGPCLCREKPRD